MKHVFLNGVLIGEHLPTGDPAKDEAAARQMLIDKGLHQEVTLPQAMYRQAVSFCTTSAYLYEHDLRRVPRNGLSIAPFVVNSAFAVELYLKTLGVIYQKKLTGHKLLKILDALPTQAKRAIDVEIPKCPPRWTHAGSHDLRKYVSEIDNAFVEWRYIYEFDRSSSIGLETTIFVMEVLHLACGTAGKF